jgi:hypothetical protein
LHIKRVMAKAVALFPCPELHNELHKQKNPLNERLY